MREFWRRLRLAFRAVVYILREGPGDLYYKPLVALSPPDSTDTFCIRRHVGPDFVIEYEGCDGGAARRVIEALREEDAVWDSERNGEPWDWGPR